MVEKSMRWFVQGLSGSGAASSAESARARERIGSGRKCGRGSHPRRLFASILALAFSSSTLLAHAQYSRNNQTNIIDGETITAYSDHNYSVGNMGSGDGLIVKNGGKLFDIIGSVGGRSRGNSNCWAQVVGVGSVWSNSGKLSVGLSSSGNALVISNGGQVLSGSAWVGLFGRSNTVIVTGSGSVWSNSADLVLFSLPGNTVTINNGGALYSLSSCLGTAGYHSAAIVTGSGSVWSSSGSLTVGCFSRDTQLLVSNGGSVDAQSVVIGARRGSNNVLAVHGGSCVTTNTGFGALDVRRGALSLNSGTVLANQLIATNGAASVLQFSAGSLDVGVATVVNGQLLVAGDGVQVAKLNLRGGTNCFASGLNIASNSQLTGAGCITNGNVLVGQGGLLAPGSGRALGTLAFSNNLTIAGKVGIKLSNLSGANGTGDYISVTGLLDLTGGTISFNAPTVLSNSVYVFGTYGALRGKLSATEQLPSGYVLKTAYRGNQLALVVPTPLFVVVLLLIVGALLLLGTGVFGWRRWRT